jgi:hypothetical protein
MILASHGIISSISQGVVPLLDIYGSAAAAYSLRKLRTAYTGNAIRVRRTDLTEQDIGFTSSGNLDTAALLSFVGTGALDNGFVTTWYDQSGNSRNLLQSNAIQQPKIVNGGSLITMSGIGSSFPCLQFDGVNDMLTISDSFMNTYPLSIFSTVKASTSGVSSAFTAANSTNDALSIGAGITASLIANSFKYFGTFVEANISGVATNNQIGLVISIFDNLSNSFYTYINNSTSATNTNAKPTVNNFSVGALNRPSTIYYPTIIGELVVYPTNQTTNKNNINTNINSYYGIY